MCRRARGSCGDQAGSRIYAVREAMSEDEISPELEELYRYVGNRVREERKTRGLTQGQLAELTGLRSSYVFSIEVGGSNVTLRMLHRLANALNLMPGDLLPFTRGGPLTEMDAERVRTICRRLSELLRARGGEDATVLRELGEFLGGSSEDAAILQEHEANPDIN